MAEKTLKALREEFDHAIMMANIGRDPSWLPVINKLDAEIKERTRDI